MTPGPRSAILSALEKFETNIANKKKEKEDQEAKNKALMILNAQNYPKHGRSKSTKKISTQDEIALKKIQAQLEIRERLKKLEQRKNISSEMLKQK
jgi:hypothetical protein